MTRILALLLALAPLPSLASGAVRAEAWGIAVSDLQLNTQPLEDGSHILLTGANQYRMLWARDFSTSVGGALIAGKAREVRDSLALLFRFQREDGLLPRLVDNRGIRSRVLLGLFGHPPPFEEPLKGWFETEYGAETMDANVLVPWAASAYVAATGDRAFAERYYGPARRALGHVASRFVEDGLVSRQPVFSDWQDSIRRQGRVAATNVYYVLAQRGMAVWAERLGRAEEAREYRHGAELSLARFNAFFWNEERGIVRNFEGNEAVAADANLLPVVHGLLPPARAARVLESLRATPLWAPLPGRATWPDYDRKLKGSNLAWAGIRDYFDGMHWMWITSLAARAERAAGDRSSCERILDGMSEQIARDGHVYEVYDRRRKDGELRPVRRPLYRSEGPFTWSAAMALEALDAGCSR